MNLKDKVWVITGGSSGIGRRTAIDVAAAGARVCIAARREDRLEKVVEELPGEDHSYAVTDVSDRHQVDRLVSHVDRAYGRCDVLVNNAGFSRESRFGEPQTIENLHDLMATNFFGAAYCTAGLLPLLKRSKPSHVVNVASMAGRLAVSGSSAYSASKFALVGWSECLHYELADAGINVSSVAPGPVPTEGFPQAELRNDRLLRFALSSESDVSKAIRDAVAHRKVERVVPRWYYLLQVPRLLVPPLYRVAQNRFMRIRDGRGSSPRSR